VLKRAAGAVGLLLCPCLCSCWWVGGCVCLSVAMRTVKGHCRVQMQAVNTFLVSPAGDNNLTPFLQRLLQT
jgi:hypothetical protein